LTWADGWVIWYSYKLACLLQPINDWPYLSLTRSRPLDAHKDSLVGLSRSDSDSLHVSTGCREMTGVDVHIPDTLAKIWSTPTASIPFAGQP
jgi:hypothetical protein